MENIILKCATAYFFFLCSLFTAQTLGSRLDKTTLALGEVGTYTVNISNLQGKPVQIAPKNELLPFHFEEVKDSTSVSPEFYDRNITFAVFEEGKYTIPAIEVRIDGELFKTIPYEVEVINTATKDDQINDIMGNKKASLALTDYWELYKWYVYAALLLVAIAVAVYYLVRYNKRQRSAPKVTTNQTLRALNALRKKKYIEADQYRAFYVELIDITRNFITSQYHIPADVLLTDDLIALMKKTNSISPENEKIIEDIFVRGDMVKFAKTFPDQPVMEKDFTDITAVVKNSVKDLEVEKLRKGV